MSEELKTKEIDIIDDVAGEIYNEILNESKFNQKVYKDNIARKKNFILTILEKMLGKLLTKLKITITVEYNEKVLFTYVIPKN